MSFLLGLGSVWTWIRENVIFALTILVLLFFMTTMFQCNRKNYWWGKYQRAKEGTKKIDTDRRGPIRRILFGDEEVFEDEAAPPENAADPSASSDTASCCKKCKCVEGGKCCCKPGLCKCSGCTCPDCGKG